MVWEYFESITYKPKRRLPPAKSMHSFLYLDCSYFHEYTCLTSISYLYPTTYYFTVSEEMQMEDKRNRDEFRQQSQESDVLIHDPRGVVYRANVSDVARPGDSVLVLFLHCRTNDGKGGVCAAEGVHSILGLDFALQCCTVRMVHELSKWFETSLVCGEAAITIL